MSTQSTCKFSGTACKLVLLNQSQEEGGLWLADLRVSLLTQIWHPSFFFREKSFVLRQTTFCLKLHLKSNVKNSETIKRYWKSPRHFWEQFCWFLTSNLKCLDSVQLREKCFKDMCSSSNWWFYNSIQLRGMYTNFRSDKIKRS